MTPLAADARCSRNKKLAAADALTAATAAAYQLPLITRDHDFADIDIKTVITWRRGRRCQLGTLRGAAERAQCSEQERGSSALGQPAPTRRRAPVTCPRPSRMLASTKRFFVPAWYPRVVPTGKIAVSGFPQRCGFPQKRRKPLRRAVFEE